MAGPNDSELGATRRRLSTDITDVRRFYRVHEADDAPATIGT